MTDQTRMDFQVKKGEEKDKTQRRKEFWELEGGRTGGRWMEVGQQERRVEETRECEEKRQPPLGCVFPFTILFHDIEVAVQAE